MNRREIAAMVVRSLSLIIFAQMAYYALAAIQLLGISVLGSSSRGGTPGWHDVPVILYSCMLAAGGMVAILYWVKAPAIATRMVSGNPGPVRRISFGVRDAMILAYSAAGLFILLDGFQRFLAAIYLWQCYESYHDAFHSLWMLPDMWKAFAQLALAFWLVVGSPGIVALIDRLRLVGGPHHWGEGASQREESPRNAVER